MNFCYRLLFILLAFFMIGCPLVSKFPLGNSRSAPMDERYIGKWAPIKSKDHNVETLWIFPFNENEYYMEFNNNTKDKVIRLRSYLTVVDNVNILNVQPIGDENEIAYMPDREYFFIKIFLSDNNTITLWNIDKIDFIKDSSKEELFQYVQKNIRNDNVYDKFDTFKRK